MSEYALSIKKICIPPFACLLVHIFQLVSSLPGVTLMDPGTQYKCGLILDSSGSVTKSHQALQSDTKFVVVVFIVSAVFAFLLLQR